MQERKCRSKENSQLAEGEKNAQFKVLAHTFHTAHKFLMRAFCILIFAKVYIYMTNP